MAKRELIDRKTLIDNGLSKGFCEWYDEIKQAEVITEQDIVKPYLDKIRAEMFEEMLSHSGTGEEVIQAYVSGLKKGLYILDKYKAESEGKG